MKNIRVEEPIHKQIEKELTERIKILKQQIDGFDTPITKEDYADNFKSRLSGAKSSKALRGYYDELLERE